MRKSLMVTTLLLLACTAYGVAWPLKQTLPPVAHAGGIYKGMRYTSALEALDVNYARGFRVFEMDLQQLADGNVVCLHSFTTLNLPQTATLQDVAKTRAHLGYTPCTAQTLGTWLHLHPDAKLVTDIKSPDQTRTLRILKTYVKPSQTIVQIYDPAEYAAVKKLGFNSIILTLYRYSGPRSTLPDFARNHPLYAITMPVNEAFQGGALPFDTPVYIHTVNTCLQARFAAPMGVSGIYTDDLSPTACN